MNTKSLLTRIGVPVLSLGLLGGLGATLATSASASTLSGPNPGNGAVVITSQAQADALAYTINKNVDVPAGVFRIGSDENPAPIWFGAHHVTGNVSVEGQLAMASDIVDGNVTVTGPGSFLQLTNQASHFEHNLTVHDSSGVYTGGPGTTSFGNWTQYAGADLPTAVSQVDGSFTFVNNSGSLYSAYPMHVSGSFTYTGNTGPVLDRGGLTVDGASNVS